MKKIIFEIDSPGEAAAGIRPSYDQIAIEVDSGDPGGSPVRRGLRRWRQL